MKRVCVFSARSAPDAALVGEMLRGFGFGAENAGDPGTQGGTPVIYFYGVTVPEDEAEEARETLRAQGMEPVEKPG